MSIYHKMGGSGKKPEVTDTTDPEEQAFAQTDTEEAASEYESHKSLTHLSREQLETQLNETEAKSEEYKNQLLRTHADLENIRKRAQEDVRKAHKYGIERLINELLPILDSLERGLSIEVGDNEFAQRLREGLEMTHSLFLSSLEKQSVKAINPLHQPFNPELHQAISTQENAELPANTVVQVLQKGYQLHDRLIRPALVIVSK